MKNFISKIKKSVWWEKLSCSRIKHIENVHVTCVKYNGIFKLNLSGELILKTAYLHDISKGMNFEEEKNFVKKNKIYLDKYERQARNLYHAPISAYISSKYFNINDKSIVKTIRYHTIGSENISKLFKLLYFSDIMSPDRKLKLHIYINNNLDKGLDKLILVILNEKIKYLLKIGKLIHPNILKFRNKLLEM